jgi:maltose/maltodextrin transport system permease protein
MVAVSDLSDRTALPLARWALTAVAGLSCLYAAFLLYTLAQPLFGAMMLALGLGTLFVFGSARTEAWRFIFPGFAAVLIFVAFPVIYTIWLGFTNYSSFNLLTYDRAVEVLMSNKTIDATSERPFAVSGEPGAYRLWFPEDGLLSDPVALDGSASTVALAPAAAPAVLLPTKDAIKLREGLKALDLTTPDGGVLKNSGLKTFAAVTSEYQPKADGTFLRVSDGAVLHADPARGVFVTEAGEDVPPGWRVNIGLANFTRIFTLDGIRGPMLSIFVWTVAFALISVAGTFALGLLLAVILQWPHLRGKAIYRILLILPYAVPSFISILVFRGLFNQNFGEINLILGAVFGIRPDWFTDGTLARIMIVIVNLWLGYPYMMLLAMGFLQGVPEDHKKAAALEGASALRVFFTITLPQILPPFVPLLIATFAFNFNNIVLILLMTRGGPDIPGTAIPAGETDILGSFTYRVAFMDTGTQFGLAGAITFLIFVVVALIAYVNFVAMRRAANRKRGLT